MNNFDLNREAQELADSSSKYALAKEVLLRREEVRMLVASDNGIIEMVLETYEGLYDAGLISSDDLDLVRKGL